MAQERIDIVITENGSRVVRRNLEDIGGTARQSADAVDFLKRALGTLGAAFGLREIVRMTSAWTDLTSRVNIAAGSVEAAGAVMGRLQAIARRTYAELGNTAEIYLSNAAALTELGYSTQQQLDFTEAMTNALVVSGAKAQRAETVINALSKAMMAGKLSGENWNTVLQQGGRVVEALAEGTGKSIQELRDMAAAGKLSSETVFTALMSQLEKLREEADSMPATISDALTVLGNRLLEVVGRLDEASGFSDVVVQGLDFIAEHLEVIIQLAGSVAAGFLVVGGTAAVINGVRTAVVALNAAIAANPVGAFLIVLTATITALTLFRDEINLGIDDVTTLGDLMRAAWEDIAPLVSALAGVLTDFFNWITGAASTAFNNVTDSAAGSLEEQEAWWLRLVRTVVRVFDMIGGTVRGVMRGILNVVGSVIDALMNNFRQLGNALRAALDLDLDGIRRAVSTNLDGWRQVGANIGSNFEEGFREEVLRQADSGLESMLDSWITRAQEIARERVAAAQTTAPDLSANGGGSRVNRPDPEAAKALQKLRDELDALVGSYDRVWAAQKAYMDAVTLLERAEAAGLITAERKAQVLAIIEAQLRDAMDPMAAINRQLDEERQLLRLTSEQREIEIQLRAIEQDLRGQGILLGEEELRQLRERLQLIQEETRAAEARNRVLQQMRGPQQEFADQLKAINELIAEGTISKAEATAFLVQQNQSLLEGTIEAQQAWVAQYEETYAQIEALRQADLISEQTAVQLKARANAELYAKQLAGASQFFGSLAGLSRSSNREIAAIGKAAAVTQATIDGVLAVQKALASAPPPANYALAAAVGVQTAANIAQIMAQTPGFAFGGDFTVGGTGGTDSQMVAFRATPGERVSIRTPTQERDEARQGGGEGQQGGGSAIRVVNVIDPNLMQDYLTSSSGERVLLNVIQRNAGAVRQVVNNG